MANQGTGYHYINNSFKNATDTSQRLAYLIGEDHQSSLNTAPDEPLIIQLRASFSPVFSNFKSSYVNRLIVNREAHSSVMSTSNSFEELVKLKSKEWELAVQFVYREGTPDYGRIFPDGLKPFYSGIREDRISAIEAFLGTIVADPNFTELSVDVQIFITDINLKFETLKENHKKQAQAGRNLEEQRIILTENLYGNLGLLMNKFQSDPVQIESFFNFNLLRHPVKDEHEEFSGSVAASQTANIIDRIFTDSSEVLISNTGVADLKFCLTTGAVTGCQSTGLLLKAGESRDLLVSDLGNLNNRFLNVTNIYSTEIGYYSLTIIK